MPAAQHFKWLPNTITAIRMIASVPIFVAVLNQAWTLALGLFVTALMTDFLDGLAAKKLNAKSKFGEQLDPLADSSLVVAGMVGLSVTGHLAWWFTAAILLFGLTVGNQYLVRPTSFRGKVVQKIAAVSCLFIAWTGIAWFFAALAFGWSWWYVLCTLLVLLSAAALKRHRLSAWLGRSV